MREALTPAEKRAEWARFVKASPKGYMPQALCAVLENDGLSLLESVLTELKIERTADLIKQMSAE